LRTELWQHAEVLKQQVFARKKFNSLVVDENYNYVTLKELQHGCKTFVSGSGTTEFPPPSCTKKLRHIEP
jgi:hypothetical protein